MAKLNILTQGIRGYAIFDKLGVIPVQTDEPDRDFKDCCYTQYVFASTGDPDVKFNDYKAILNERPASDYTIDYSIIKDGGGPELIVNDGKYGALIDFGDIEDLPDHKGFRADFRTILLESGEGDYQFQTEFKVGGVPQSTIITNTYSLVEFNYGVADKTVRIESIQNGRLQRNDLNYIGAEWLDMIRVTGYFGNRQLTREDVEYQGSDFNHYSATNEQNGAYQFETDFIPICIYNEIVDYHFMAGEIYMSDYNGNNISYDLFRIPVKINTIENTNYPIQSRKAKISYTLGERNDNNRMTIC